MEIKKSPKANLEKGKGFSLLMGLVVALSLVYVAIEWRSQDKYEDIAAKANVADMEDALFIPDAKEPEPPKPEPPKPEQKIEIQLPEEFKVVDNEKKVVKVELVSADQKKLPPKPVVLPPAPEEEEEKIFDIVEDQPVPPGGSFPALLKWIARTIVYPEIAIENQIQGRVIVQFVVEKNGTISQAKVVRGVDPSLDREAMRVVNKMGKWKPGKQLGQPVRSKFTLPIMFKLK